MYNYYILFVYYCLQKVSFEVFLCFNFWLNEGLVDLFVKQNSWAMLAQYSTLSKWGDFLFKGSFILSWTWGQQIFLQFFSPLSALESILRTMRMDCLWLNQRHLRSIWLNANNYSEVQKRVLSRYCNSNIIHAIQF